MHRFKRLEFKKRAWLTVSAVVVLLVLALAGWSLLSNKDTPADKSIGEPTLIGSQYNFSSKQQEMLLNQYYLPCKSQTCIYQAAKDLTNKYDPQTALSVLSLYRDKYPKRLTGDSHEWAHIVGHATAKKYGINGKAFLMCPTTFNYGCMHGFFEEALSRGGSERQVIDSICGSLEKDSSYSSKFVFYCYHGVGHGLMQSYEYDLGKALAVCDSLVKSADQEGCWQGVFMENINGSMTGDSKPGVFKADDPLAPCDTIASKYWHECYINQGAHLAITAAYDVNKAAAYCQKADQSQIEACGESLGILVSSDSWQSLFLKPGDSSDPTVASWAICQRFPPAQVQSCVLGAVDWILQNDELNLKRAGQFCGSTIADAYAQRCYQQVGSAVASQSINKTAARNICQSLPAAGRSICSAEVGA